MIEMERIQNLNLGQEADEKVEDDQRTRFHIEHQSKLRRDLLAPRPLPPTSARPALRGECEMSAPSIGIPSQHEREPLQMEVGILSGSYDN